MSENEELIKRLPDVLQVLVDWENENGTLAGILPNEYAALMDKLTDAAILQSPRQAAAALSRSGPSASGPSEEEVRFARRVIKDGSIVQHLEYLEPLARAVLRAEGKP